MGIPAQHIYLLLIRSLFTDPYSFKNPMYIRDAIFFSSPRLAKKRRQIRLLDYWQFKSFCTPFRFVYTNLTSSNFFTERAGFDLTVSLGALAKIRKKKLWTRRFIAIRLGICVSSSLFKEYSVILHIL